MENCTTTANNITICYIAAAPSSSSGGGGPSLRHDFFLAIITVVSTCAAVAAYNFYIDWLERKLKEKKKKKKKQSIAKKENNVEGGASKDYGSTQSSSPTTAPTKLSPNKSIAASLAHIEGMEASGNFLTGILSQMWNHMNVAVSNTIKDTLEPILKDLPVPLHFVKLDLGNVPITTKNMFIHRVDLDSSISGQKSNQAGIQIDVDVEWDGNCDIMLQATVNRAIKPKFGIQHFKLFGRLHILLSPLTTELPVISAVQYGFTNTPDIQLDYTGLVQSLTSKFSVIQSGLLGVIKSSLAGVMVLPQRLVMPMDLGSYDYLDTYKPPVGMVRITAVKGRGFKVERKKFFKDIPDVYCKISLGASALTDPPFKTSVQKDCLAPLWDEAGDFILYDMDQKVYVEVWDKDSAVDEDDELGAAEVSVRDLFRNDGPMELELALNGEKNDCFITLGAELFHLSEHLQSLTSGKYWGKDQLCGLVTIIVTKAMDVPIPREDAATYVKVVYGDDSDHEKTFYTGTVTDYPGIDALNPMFDCVFHVPVTAAMIGGGGSPKKSKNNKNNITFELIDVEGANGTKGNGTLGEFTVTHESLVRANNHTITKTSHIGTNGAKLEYRISLKGMVSESEQMRWLSASLRKQANSNENNEATMVSLYGGLEDSNGVTIRVTAMRGRGFPIKKRALGKKEDVPDVYCSVRLKSSSREVWKTAMIKDDTMPHWNEPRDYTNIIPSGDFILVDVYEANSKGSDELLGQAKFSIERLLRKRLMEVEIQRESTGLFSTGMYVTFMCIQLGTSNEVGGGINAVSGTNDEVLVHYHPQMGDEGFESTLLK
jgi:hypothetical protein